MPNNLTDVTDNNVGKITDNEIKKALEWLTNKTKEYCERCGYKNSEICDICFFDKTKLALDLINRLQAENERLTHITRNLIGEIKAEAYTEFAERLKENITEKYNYFEEQEYPRARITDIDNLLKEMVGE